MDSGKPGLRQQFDKVERAVGKPLEDIVASPTYADLMVLALKVQRTIGGGVARIVGEALGTVLHAANIPTRSDVDRLSRQLAILTGELRSLATLQHDASRREVAAAPSEDDGPADHG